MARLTPSPLALAVRRRLASAGNPTRALAMQAYMRSQMPFWGVGSAERRAIFADAFRSHPPTSARVWQASTLELWRGARCREEWYAAIELYVQRRFTAFRTVETLPVLEEMIVNGAWWDVVDPLASHGLGDLLRRFPAVMKRRVRSWSRAQDPWKRRAAIICQLRSGEQTDLELLYACIEPSLGDRPSSGTSHGRDFFIKKAIGWALREVAWREPTEIQRYVRSHADRLDPLSRREALKNLRPSPKKKRPRKKPLKKQRPSRKRKR